MLVLVFSGTVLNVGSVFCLTELLELIELTIVCWPPVGPQDIKQKRTNDCERTNERAASARPDHDLRHRTQTSEIENPPLTFHL